MMRLFNAANLASSGPLRLSATVLAVAALSLAASASQDTDQLLRSLCSGAAGNQQQAVELTRKSQVRALVERLNSSDSSSSAVECPARVRRALVELEALIRAPDEGGEDICSLAEVQRIRDYNERYITSSLNAEHNEHNEHQDGQVELPRGLRDFVLGYGLRVSNLCKKNMISSLQFEARQLLTSADFEAIGPWTDESSAIGRIMNEPSDYDDLLLPRDLSRVLDEEAAAEQGNHKEEADDDDDDDKIFMQTATGELVGRVQALCERRFKPLYEQLILPLIYLSNMGFNYQGEDLEREMKEMSVNKEVHQWYRIVYLCESLTGIQIVQQPSELHDTQGTDKRLVRILSREEAERQLAAAAGHTKPPAAYADIEPVVYPRPELANRLEDEVLALEDRNLMRLVHSFARHKSELDRIRARLLRKLAAFLFDKLKRGQFRLIHSMIAGAPKRAAERNAALDGGQSADSEQLVRAIDDFVSQAAGAESGEQPVASLQGKVSVMGGVARRYYHQAAVDGVGGLSARVAKKTIDKARVSRYFYYAVALTLFIIGIVGLSATG